MNEDKLINNYLDLLSQRASNTVDELKLLQKHIADLKSILVSKPKVTAIMLETAARADLLGNKVDTLRHPNDLIRMTEVVSMTGISKSTIYSYINNGAFPNAIKLGARSVAWQRRAIDEWISNKLTA
ncbi:MAG: helix-turn-helix transcriptional regulator [Thalassotalea sp.]